MFHAHVRPVRELRNNYPELAAIVKQRDHVIITNNGKSEAVLISIDEFRRYEEYLVSSKRCLYRFPFICQQKVGAIKLVC